MCIAVGSRYVIGGAGGVGDVTSEKTVAERWNGKEWSVQTTPNPTAATHSLFEGVSCGSRIACTAVGSWYGPKPGFTG